MKYLAHWYYMLRATLWLSLTFSWARWYFFHRAIQDLGLPPHVLLSSKEQRRLQHYFYGGAFLSVIFMALRGRLRTPAEKRRLTNMAALAYYFDDLVDAYRQKDDSGILWKDNPEDYGLAADDHRRLALHFLHNVYADLPADSLVHFKAAINRVFNVETAGRQMSSQLSLSDIQGLSAEKGGYSVLLFRLLHDPLPSESEANACLSFGRLIQYCDDIFDLWFDHRDGVATIATALAPSDLDQLHTIFEAQVERVKADFRAISAPARHIETALAVVHYITAITKVCLRHYRQLSQKNAQLPVSDRAKIVVDMERWKYRFATAWVLAFEPIGPTRFY